MRKFIGEQNRLFPLRIVDDETQCCQYHQWQGKSVKLRRRFSNNPIATRSCPIKELKQKPTREYGAVVMDCRVGMLYRCFGLWLSCCTECSSKISNRVMENSSNFRMISSIKPPLDIAVIIFAFESSISQTDIIPRNTLGTAS